MKSSPVNSSFSTKDKPALLSKKGGGQRLSALVLLELLQAVLDKGVPFRFRAKGFSMSPFIKDGDVITISPLTNDFIRTGDVVAFIHPTVRRLVIHRVLGKKNGYFHIKGDNIHHTGELIPEVNILGCLNRIERNGKEVFFGLGPERLLIAFLTKRGILLSLLYPIWQIMRPIVRRTFF